MEENKGNGTDMTFNGLIDKIVRSYKQILGDNLVGVYLHGSYVMSGFNPKVSDIDFLIVVKDEVADADKHRIIELLLEIGKSAPAKGLEMSMMQLEDTLYPKKPTKFLLHWSDYHMPRYQIEPEYLCVGEDDPDLLAHMTVVRARGKCVYGLPIEEVFGEVDSSHYIDAIMYDLNDARGGIESDYEYFVLNICRSIRYFREGYIGSKYEGGYWALDHLQDKYKSLVQVALDKYSSSISEVNASQVLLGEFLADSFREIDEYVDR